MMRLIPFALILCALPFPGTGRAQEHALTFSPFLSYDRYQGSGFDAGFDYGAAAALRLAAGLSVRAEASFGPRTITYDVVGGTQSLSGRVSEISLGAEYRLWGSATSAALSLSLGGGRIGATVDATTVSLGALGTLTIPARSSAHGFLEGGLTAAVPLTGRVGVFLRPAYRSGAAGPAADYSLEGGLRVGLF